MGHGIKLLSEQEVHQTTPTTFITTYTLHTPTSPNNGGGYRFVFGGPARKAILALSLKYNNIHFRSLQLCNA